MPTYANILASMLPVFGVILLGALLRRTGALSEESDRSILRVVLNVFTPCLIFSGILGNSAATSGPLLWLAPLCGVAAIAISIGVIWLAAPLFGLPDAPRRKVFAFTCGLYNYAYIAIPLAMNLFDRTTVGVLFLVNVGVEIGLWTFGPLMLSGGPSAGAWRKAFNAPFFAIVAGVGVTLGGLAPHTPEALLAGIHMLGACAVPLALLMIGAVTLDFLEPRTALEGAGATAGAVVMRLGVLPPMLIGLALLLPGPPELRRVLILHAAMPAAAFPIILVRKYAGDVPTALRVYLSTSVASLVLSPFWISRGLEWMGR